MLLDLLVVNPVKSSMNSFIGNVLFSGKMAKFFKGNDKNWHIMFEKIKLVCAVKKIHLKFCVLKGDCLFHDIYYSSKVQTSENTTTSNYATVRNNGP